MKLKPTSFTLPSLILSNGIAFVTGVGLFYMKKIEIHKGDQFGRLTVIEPEYFDSNALCKCDCGNMVAIRIKNLVRKASATRSCGCLRAEWMRKNQKIANILNVKHGESGTRLYNIWQHIKYRTTDPKCKYYHSYGGRGIVMCDEWKDSTVFITWAKSHGYSDNLEIDRKDNEKGYYPENCHWVTHSENMLNKRKSPDVGISFVPSRNMYFIGLQRNKKFHYGGHARTIEEARIKRNLLLEKIELLK